MSIFKAYDIRGVYPSEINENIAYSIGRAIVDFYKLKDVCVGRDIRLSSNSLFNSLVRGITDQGANVHDIGLCSTPAFYFAVSFYKFEFGIMVTASHNPKEYNGLKLVDNRNFKIQTRIGYENGLDKIEEIVTGSLISDYFGDKGESMPKEIVDDYIRHIIKFADRKEIRSAKRFKVVIDASNGTGSIGIKDLFEELGMSFGKNVIPLSFEMEGDFPDHGPNPSSPGSMDKLKKEVRKNKANLGVAFDGDADRAIFVDEKGKLIAPESVLIMLARSLINPTKSGRGKKEAVIYDLTSSRIVKEELRKIANPIVSRVGQESIMSSMRSSNAILGGEVSGHYNFRDNYSFDSGIITLIIIMNHLIKTKKKISAIVSSLSRYSKTEGLSFDVKDKSKVLENIEQRYKGAKTVFYLDGLTVEYDSWWFNLRPSNTEPIVRLVVEANTKAAMNKRVEELKRAIKGSNR